MAGGDFQRIAGFAGVPAPLKGCVVAIGNFDGVHRGHQAVLNEALEEARRRDVPALVLTFEPHPRSVFRPDQPLFRLTTAPMRARVLRAMGFDGVVEQGFSRSFAEIPADEFVQEIIVRGLGAVHVVAGHDFHYGKGRAGTPATLTEAGAASGFTVSLVDALLDDGGEPVSSSRIRSLLAAGQLSEAERLLGYHYTVEAEIIHGKQLGRTLGFPTANMELPDSGLAHGIYAVKLRRPGGAMLNGVASFGRRPTVDDDGAPLLETFVFDVKGDFYGETCGVSFFEFLRGEEKFDGLDALVEQMKRDEAAARKILAAAQPLGSLDARLCF
jgi:riboflavin kinase/FMN adenylyltransferase